MSIDFADLALSERVAAVAEPYALDSMGLGSEALEEGLELDDLGRVRFFFVPAFDDSRRFHDPRLLFDPAEDLNSQVLRLADALDLTEAHAYALIAQANEYVSRSRNFTSRRRARMGDRRPRHLRLVPSSNSAS